MTSKFNFFSILCTFIFISISCKNNSDNLQNEFDFDWLTGNWENNYDSVISSEKWEKINDSLYSGFGFMLSSDDTVFKENITIKREGENTYYMPVIAGEVYEKLTSFKLISKVEGKHYIFENKLHDFPQRIIYKLINKDSILATIEGYQNDTFRQEFFPFKRIK
ncbi:MAG: DUF6265 family protein [Bacteroidota bacterium]